MARPPRTLDQSNYEVILIDKRDDGVAVITLNRPERHNAVGGPMHSELWQLPGDIQDDPDVRVAVITGAGRSFCSGADVEASSATRRSTPRCRSASRARRATSSTGSCGSTSR